MDPNVGGDVISLDGCSPAGAPGTGKVQIVCTLASDMFFADVILAGVSGDLSTGRPRLTKRVSGDVHFSVHLSH